MTRDDITRMARESGLWYKVGFPKEIERFAALVAEATLEKNNLTWVANCQHLVAAEREACALVVERNDNPETRLAAAAIRARGINGQ